MADLTITAANVGVGGTGLRIRTVQVGEAVTQGQPAYLHTDGKHYQADANDTEQKALAVGVFMTAAGVDGYAVMATEGPLIVGGTLTVGELYAVSAAKGAIAPIADLGTGDYVTTLGVASTTTVLDLSPQASGIAKP